MSSETVEVTDVDDLADWVATHLVKKYMDGADFPDEYAVDVINHILNDYNSHNYDDLVTFLADAVDWKEQTFKRRIWDTLTDEEKAELVNRLVRRIAEDGMMYYLDIVRENIFYLTDSARGELAKQIRDRYLNGSISFQDMIKGILWTIRPDIDEGYKLRWAQTGFELAKYLDEGTVKKFVRGYLKG
jgi:disulfide oxidoreductase YuzD